MRYLTVIAALAGLGLVIVGAMGAHALSGLGEQQRSSWDSAMLYGFVHVLAVLLTSALPGASGLKRISGIAFLAGVVLFSGVIIARTFGQTGGGDALKAIAMLTPIGGVAFMVGWLLLAVATLRGPKT